MDRLYEYDGIDIYDQISEDAYKLVCAVGNHQYRDYEGLKLLISNIFKLEPNSISEIIASLTNLELRSMELNNPLVSIGYNKRIHDYFSIICALNDCGYTFDSNIYSANMFKIRGNLILKNGHGLDIMIDNPTKFNYATNDKDSVSFNKHLISLEKINGLELCNLMFYIGSNNYKDSSTVLKHGNFIKSKERVKVLNK